MNEGGNWGLYNAVKNQTFPLGIEIENINQHYGDYSSRRIVCIGRLVDFKTYNESIIINFKKLLEKDPRFVCDIYGFGVEEKRLKELVIELELTEVIRFKGKLNVDDIPTVLSGAFVSMGGGIINIQSSSLGIPSIVCVDSNPNFTSPGYYADVLKDYYLDLSLYSDKELYNITDIIDQLLSKDFSEYEVLCERHVSRTEKLNIKQNYKDFLGILSEPKTINYEFNVMYYAWSFMLNRKSKEFENRFLSDVKNDSY